MRSKEKRLLLFTLFVTFVVSSILSLLHSQEVPGISVNQQKQIRLSKFLKKYLGRKKLDKSNIFKKFLRLKNLSSQKKFINGTNYIYNHSSIIENFYNYISPFGARGSYDFIKRNTISGKKIKSKLNYRTENNRIKNYVPNAGRRRNGRYEKISNLSNVNSSSTYNKEIEHNLKLNYQTGTTAAHTYAFSSTKYYNTKQKRFARQIEKMPFLLSRLKNLSKKNNRHGKSSFKLQKKRFKKPEEKNKKCNLNARLQNLFLQCLPNSNNNGLDDCQRKVPAKCAIKILNDRRNIDKDVCELYQFICPFLIEPLKNEPCPCKEKPFFGNYKGRRAIDKKGKLKYHFCRSHSTKAFKTSLRSRPHPCHTSPRTPPSRLPPPLPPRDRVRQYDDYPLPMSSYDSSVLPDETDEQVTVPHILFGPFPDETDESEPESLSSPGPLPDETVTAPYSSFGPIPDEPAPETLSSPFPLSYETDEPVPVSFSTKDSLPDEPPSLSFPLLPSYIPLSEEREDSESEVKPSPFQTLSPSPPFPPSTDSQSSEDSEGEVKPLPFQTSSPPFPSTIDPQSNEDSEGAAKPLPFQTSLPPFPSSIDPQSSEDSEEEVKPLPLQNSSPPFPSSTDPQSSEDSEDSVKPLSFQTSPPSPPSPPLPTLPPLPPSQPSSLPPSTIFPPMPSVLNDSTDPAITDTITDLPLFSSPSCLPDLSLPSRLSSTLITISPICPFLTIS